MNEQTKLRCEQLISNKDIIKAVFRGEGIALHLLCAGIYTATDRIAEEKTLKYSYKTLKSKAGILSPFRSPGLLPIVDIMANNKDPEQVLDNALDIFKIMKKGMGGRTHQPLAAMMIAQSANPMQYEQIAERTKVIYKLLKQGHRFLRSGEDVIFCVLMALADKTDDNVIQLIRETETCYNILKGSFSSSNDVQFLSIVLALCDGQADAKCKRTIELFSQLKSAGYKYGKNYELPILGVVAASCDSLDDIMAAMVEVDEWLSKQKGFKGFFASVNKKQRLMCAAILAQKGCAKENTTQTEIIDATVLMTVVQQMAMLDIKISENDTVSMDMVL